MALSYVWSLIAVVFISQSYVHCQFWKWHRPYRLRDLKADVKNYIEDLKLEIQQLKTEERERYGQLQEGIQNLQASVDDLGNGAVQPRPDGVVGLALESGISYLLDTRKPMVGWGSRQNGEAVMALRLADPRRFSVDSEPPNYDFIQGINDMVTELILELQRPDFQNDTLWSHGKLAQYMVGLSAACIDPQNLYGYDIAAIVREQLRDNLNFFRNQKFALSWVVLAFCNANLTQETVALDILSANPGVYTFGIDEASMIVIALSCVGDDTYLPAQRTAEDFILNGTKPNGSFGNEYTTGLAIQALTRYSGQRTDVGQIISKAQDWLAREVIGRFTNVALANQVLPALTTRYYGDIKFFSCPEQEAPAITTTPASPIQVTVTVRDTIINQSNFEQTWTADANAGDSMFQVLQKLQNQQSSFSFSSVTTSWGESIKTLVGITADSNQRQYWSFLQYPDQMMNTGVSSTFPANGDHYLFNATTW